MFCWCEWGFSFCQLLSEYFDTMNILRVSFILYVQVQQKYFVHVTCLINKYVNRGISIAKEKLTNLSFISSKGFEDLLLIQFGHESSSQLEFLQKKNFPI